MIENETNLNEEQPITGRTESQSIKTEKKPIHRGESTPQKTPPTIKIGKHGADMIMTQKPRKKQEEMLNRVALPDEPRTIGEKIQIFSQLVARSMGLTQFRDRGDCPDRIGFNLTNQSQRDVLLAVLKQLTATNYKGDTKIPNSVAVKQAYTGNTDTTTDALSKGFEIIQQQHIGGALENIPSTPVISITQRDLVILAGYDPEKQSDVQRVANAVVDLASKQNFLMWTRHKRDKKTGKKVINQKTKRQEFELVSTFSPVLWVNFVSDPTTKKFLHYEISPSPVFLDEVSAEYGGGPRGYFLLIPEEANKEINSTYKKLFPYRVRIPINIQTFCFWLRVQVMELKSRANNPLSPRPIDPVIRIKYADLCQELNISESTIKTRKKQTSQQVEEGIRVAKDLGYITDGYFDTKSDSYVMTLNIDFYPPFKRMDPEEIEDVEEQDLLPPDSKDV